MLAAAFVQELLKNRRAAPGHKQTITAARQQLEVRDNPLLSGDFQPLTWVRMWGSGRVD